MTNNTSVTQHSFTPEPQVKAVCCGLVNRTHLSLPHLSDGLQVWMKALKGGLPLLGLSLISIINVNLITLVLKGVLVPQVA